MKTTTITVGLVSAIGVGMVTLVFLKHQPPPAAASPPVAKTQVLPALPPKAVPALSEPAVPEEKPVAPSKTPQNEAARATVDSNAKTQKLAPSNPGPVQGDPPTTDQFAREALNFVGLDPEAEEYWVDAINDPRLPADERQNLIEDLNEDGLSDPKHPTLDDLPLILNRLRLIEGLAPSAMDQVNFDAFLEAYKDLINLAELARGRGEQVR